MPKNVARVGDVKEGDDPNTKAPEPVSFVTADARFALEGVADHVLIPVPMEVKPVPPLATGSAVPLYEIAKVPEVVIGEPVMLKNAGTLAPTEVTVPVFVV